MPANAGAPRWRALARVLARTLLVPATAAAAAVACQPAASAGASRAAHVVRPRPATSSAGSGWSIKHTPNPGGSDIAELYAVSCSAAAACTAVGWYASSSGDRALAERWNGTTGKWTIERTPTPAGHGGARLSAVSCPSSTTCFAVGTTGGPVTTVAEKWTASSGKWTILSSATGGEGSLNGISCASPKACTAVGSAGLGNPALAERWNGTKWTAQTVPSPIGSTLTGVSCPSATDCTAVGNTGPLSSTFAEQWNGTTGLWTKQTTVNPTRISALDGVSCTSPKACTAVGNYQIGSSPQVTLAERWNGTKWAKQATPKSTTSSHVVLNGVSCASSTSCTAVGYYYPSSGQHTLAEHWNGKTGTWAIQSTPRNPAGVTLPQLTGVSCPPSSPCTAAGYYQFALGWKTLAERS